MNEREKYWQRIRQFVRTQFAMPGEVYQIVFLIGVRELGYGFQQLDQDTKTKVFNFAAIYLMNYMGREEREQIYSNNHNDSSIEVNGDRGFKDTKNEGDVSLRSSNSNQVDGNWQEEEIYKQAIINYFKEKKII